jgi:hypothetical protein
MYINHMTNQQYFLHADIYQHPAARGYLRLRAVSVFTIRNRLGPIETRAFCTSGWDGLEDFSKSHRRWRRWKKDSTKNLLKLRKFWTKAREIMDKLLKKYKSIKVIIYASEYINKEEVGTQKKQKDINPKIEIPKDRLLVLKKTDLEITNMIKALHDRYRDILN